jgi:AraC-like DNA-binding protein
MTRASIYTLEQWQVNASKSAYQAKAMAGLMGISPRQLERRMRQVFQRCPHEWLCEQRFLKAAEALKGGLPVKNVATELGFKRASHFSREFKRFYGHSPIAFQDWNINQGATTAMPSANKPPPVQKRSKLSKMSRFDKHASRLDS